MPEDLDNVLLEGGIKIDAYREEGSMLFEGSTGRVQGVSVALSYHHLG